MRFFFLLLFVSSLSFAKNDNFLIEAQTLAKDLKTILVSNLTQKIAKDGVEKAIPFCHAQVKPLAKGAAKERIQKFSFGRVSHKIRNPENKAQNWMAPYLQEFAGRQKAEVKKDYILHSFVDGKKAYLEPLYVEAKCLLCHGEKLASNVSTQIQKLYPKDEAIGFKLGEFRGFIWVKEK